MQFWKFLKYNNAVPITLSVILLSFGTTLAASPEIREGVANSVVSSETKVLSIDNTYLVSKDLSTYTPKVTIVSVSEDADFYYVAYRLDTIDLKDSVWQEVSKDELLRVQKEALIGKDLGLYTTRELKQRIDKEISLLTETQVIERKQVSQKVVATEYSGLVGRFLDDSTETLPGYTPIVDERPAYTPESLYVASSGASQSGDTPTQSGIQNNPSGSFTIQVLGNNPALVDLNTNYADLGVLITHTSNIEFGHKIFLDGAEVPQVSISTSRPATYVVTYKTEDGAGNKAEATRTIIVGGGTPAPQPEAQPEPDAATSTPTE